MMKTGKRANLKATLATSTAAVALVATVLAAAGHINIHRLGTPSPLPSRSVAEVDFWASRA